MKKMEVNGKVYYAIIALIAFIFCMGAANAYDDIGAYKQSTPLNLNLGCSFNNTYCPSSFVCNVTIYNQNGIVINNQPMGNASYPQYNYTIPASNLSVYGLYYGRQVCSDVSVGSADYSFQFIVNPQGVNYSTTQGIIYVIMFAILISLFIFLSIIFVRTPFANQRNSEGELISINWKKYLKLFVFMMAYVCFIAIAWFAWNLSYGILQFTEMANIFYSIYRITFMGLFAFIPFMVVFCIVYIYKDKSWERYLTRGLTVS